MATKTKKTEPILVEKEVEIIEETNSSEDYITFKRSHFYSVLVVLSFAVGILVGYVAWGRTSATENSNQPSGQVAEAPTPQYIRYEIPTEGFPSHGPADAPITIVEFSDYQCPFCSRFHDETYQALLDAYPGQIRFVYRNFPLDFHQNAFPAAEAALCAGDQNSYWEMHEVLFGNQASLNNEIGEVLGQTTYTQYATELGLDITVFEDCMTTHKYEQTILDDMEFSKNLGVQSTPTFFINGLAIVGAQPLANFTQLIDSELAGEIPQ